MNQSQKLPARLLSAFLLFCLYLVFTPRTSAQNAAGLDVTVLDPKEATVTDATVMLQAIPPAGDARQVSANGDGRYRFDVPPGRYRLTITHSFLKRSEREVTLAAGPRQELRVALQLEPLAQSVVVSADALAIETKAASEPVTVIAREEIDRRQSIHIGPLLNAQPGIMVVQAESAGGISSVFLDGGTSNFTKVLVDGVTVNQPGGVVDFSNFSLDAVDKIEIVRGAQSALSGSDAMTGVIEVLTHRGSTRTPRLLLEGEGGTFSTGHGLAQLSGLAGRLDYSAAAAYFSTRGQSPNNRFLNRTLSGNFGVRLGEESSLRLTLRNNTSDAGTPGQTAFTPPNLDQHNALQNFSAGLAWDGSTGVHWQHHVSVSETHIRQLFDNPLGDFFDPPGPFSSCAFTPLSPNAVLSPYCDFTYNVRNQFDRVDTQAQTSYVVGRGSITAGYFYEIENAFLSALGGGHARRNNQAGFLTGRWQILPRVVVNAGFRVEDNDSFGTKVVPRVGIAFTPRTGGDLFGTTRLRFTYGEGIKEPRLDQTFGTSICNPGNPTLLPEQSRTIYAGIEQQLAHDRVRVSADYYDSRFRDIVSFTSCFPGGPCPVAPPAGCPFFGTYFNTNLARARGTTISADARVNRHLSLTGNYTLDDTRVLQAPNAFDPALAPGNRLLRQPVHSGNLALTSSFGRVSGTFAARFVGRRTDSDFLFPPLNLTSNPGYATFNVSGSVRIDSFATAFARIENLSDKSYQDILGYPAFGRAAYVGMRFTFGGE